MCYLLPLQKILGSKVDPKLKMFGISISGGVDVDQNRYPGIIYISTIFFSSFFNCLVFFTTYVNCLKFYINYSARLDLAIPSCRYLFIYLFIFWPN